MFGGLLKKMRGLLGDGAASAGLKSPDFNPAQMQGEDPHGLFRLPKAGNIPMPEAAGMKPPVSGMFARPSAEAMQYFNPPTTGVSSSMNPGDIQPMQIPQRDVPSVRPLPIAPRTPMPGEQPAYNPTASPGYAQTGNPVADMESLENRIRQDRIMGSMHGINRDVNASLIQPDQISAPDVQSGLIPTREIPKVFVPRLPGEQRPDIDPRDNPLLASRYDYVSEGMDDKGHYGRNWKDILKAGLLGADQGIQRAGGNPWGALGGFGAGAAGAAISPQKGREYIFNTAIAPGLEADLKRTQQEQDRQRRLGMEDLRMRGIEGDLRRDDINARRSEAEIAAYPERIKSEQLLRQKQLETAEAQRLRAMREPGQSSTPAPRRYNVGGSLVDEAGNVIFQGQGKTERPMTVDEAEALRASEEGTQQQIVNDSLSREMSSLKDRLTPDDRAIVDGTKLDALPSEVKAAKERWQSLQKERRQQLEKEVAENARINRQRYRGGSGQKSSSGGQMGSTAPRNLDDVMKYLQ